MNQHDLPTIERMLADMDKAFASVHKRIKPHIVQRTRDTLARENGESIFTLFNDISGPTISLAAGTVPLAGDAVNAFIQAQAELFVLNRDIDAHGMPIEDVLDQHENALKHWVKYGVVPSHPRCDLSRIGADILVTESQRLYCPATAVSLSIVRTLRHFLNVPSGQNETRH